MIQEHKVMRKRMIVQEVSDAPNSNLVHEIDNTASMV